jgi:hypothetical protein
MSEPAVSQHNCHHEWEELIDPMSGGFVRCRKCGRELDCEEDEGW